MRPNRPIMCVSLSMLPLIAGCGAEIRPDGPKRVVFTEADGTQRVLEVAPSEELRQAAIERLIVLTSDRNPQIRANAIEALSPVTERVEPIVALAINGPSASGRASARARATPEGDLDRPVRSRGSAALEAGGRLPC